MNVEKRLDRLEKLIKQLWNACQSFGVESSNCESGCCPDYEKIDIPDFPEIDNGFIYEV
jgi:hypothetical protein